MRFVFFGNINFIIVLMLNSNIRVFGKEMIIVVLGEHIYYTIID